MYIATYIMGSFYIVRSLFRFSEHITDYIFSKNILNLPISKHEKLNESIYSSLHGILVSAMASCSIQSSFLTYHKVEEKDNIMQYLTTSVCMSYFIIDLFKCLYHKKYLFIIHHLASIYLLLTTYYSFYLKENKGFYAMYLIFLLESNTLLLNIGFLLKELKFHYSITCMSWIIHLICFVSFRLLMLPILIVRFYLYEPFTFQNIIYLPNFFLIISGSVYWAYRQTIGIQKYLKENSVI